MKPVITETAITAGTCQIFEKINHNRNKNFYLQLTVTITINSLQKRVIASNKKPCKKQSVFKVAILRMLKFALSAEYARKNDVKSLPVTHVMVERSFSSPRCCSKNNCAIEYPLLLRSMLFYDVARCLQIATIHFKLSRIFNVFRPLSIIYYLLSELDLKKFIWIKIKDNFYILI